MRMAVGPLLGVRSSGTGLAMIWLWLFLIVTAISALALHRKWGSHVLIVLALVSTFLLGIPLVPLITSVAPVPYRPYVMTAVNAAFLFAALRLLWGSARRPRSAAQAR